MPLEALLVPENLTDSDSDGIGGGTGCNFIFLNLFCLSCIFFELYADEYRSESLLCAPPLTEYCREVFEKFTTFLTSKKCRNWPVFG